VQTLLKRLSLITAAVLLLSIGSSIAFAQTNDGTCRSIDAMPNPVVRAGVPGNAVSDGNVGCLIIHDGTRFVTSAASIGDIGVIRRGVKAAVEISGVSSSGGVVNFGREIQVCLRGTGVFIYRSAASTPRVSSELPAVTRQLESGAYTCALVGTTGTAVLVEGSAAPPPNDNPVVTVPEGGAPSDPAAPAPAPSSSDGFLLVYPVDGVVVPPALTNPAAPAAPADGGDAPADTTTAQQTVTLSNGETAVQLSGCRVTTTAMVRLRTAPNTGASEIITRLPYELSLQATARTTDGVWYQVIYGNGQGWVSSNYLTESAGCLD
jgi:hypothetical protein